MKITLKQVKAFGACIEGHDWLKRQKNREAKHILRKLIAEARSNWAVWYVAKLFTQPQAVAFSVFCAEQCISNYEKWNAKDKRPRQAIDAAKAWLAEPTEENRLTAKSAAGYAAWSAEAAARHAAESAAKHAAWSAAGYAAWSAEAAARYAAESAARHAAWSAESAARRAAWSAEAAAESAAGCVAESATRYAAWSAAESAAGYAAWSADESAAWSAEAAARHAAWSAQVEHAIKILGL